MLPDRAFSAVVLTSANAARAIAEHPGRAQLTALTAFTVGRRTAEAARAVGFRDVRSADGDKRDLVDLLRADLVRTDLLRMESSERAPLLYLAGEDRAGDLAAAGAARAHRRGLSRGQGRSLSAAGRGGVGAGRARWRAAFFRPQRGGLSRLRRA